MNYVKLNKIDNTATYITIDGGSTVSHSTNENYLITAEAVLVDIVDRLVSLTKTLSGSELLGVLSQLDVEEDKSNTALTVFGYTVTGEEVVNE